MTPVRDMRYATGSRWTGKAGEEGDTKEKQERKARHPRL